MKIIEKGETIDKKDLMLMSEKMFGRLVKAVVDIEDEIMVVDAELHSDEEMFLIERGSEQMNLWGINLYPDFALNDDDFIELDSMINLRPSQGNKICGVESKDIREKNRRIVKNLTRE